MASPLFGILVLVAAWLAPDPHPKTPTTIWVSLIPCAEGQSTCRAVARWTQGANYNPAIDSVRVLWRNNATGTQLRRIFTDGTTDALSIPRPPVGSPVTVKLDLCVFRVGFTSPACANPVIFPIEAQGTPPDPPTGITVEPASAAINQGGTLRARAVVRTSS